MHLDGNRSQFSVTCSFCSTTNQMTFTNVDERQPVRCSRCGAPLGEIRDLSVEGEQTVVLGDSEETLQK
ncbi:MAG TPA: hypothetical protein VGN80_05690 [Devosiaceae bacterium]|jgi:DNA-directed RNA polymerase subunit RPC12/RpoP|nr:hypothetical protein [Devosiaceae bacterium]